MNVLSLFDGISCGLQALKQAGVPVANYFASEIDKNAIKISLKNHPEIIQVGDVTTLQTSNGKLVVNGQEYVIDLIIGGSPCQGFSFAGKELNFNDPRSKLFFEYIKLRDELKPKYFFLENVVMRKQFEAVITEYTGVSPILINSSLVSAQKRARLYWTNLPAPQISDAGIALLDILELEGLQAGRVVGRKLKDGKRADNDKTIKAVQRLEINENPLKTNCLTTVQKDNVVVLQNGTHRYLTEIECERLQTLPDDYTQGVAKTHRFKMLGNAWTVKVIEYFFKGINSEEL